MLYKTILNTPAVCFLSYCYTCHVNNKPLFFNKNLVDFRKKRKVCISAGEDSKNLCSHNATNGDSISRDISLCLDSMLDEVRECLIHFKFSFSAR